MDIKGLNEFLEKEAKAEGVGIGDVLKKVKDFGVSLDTATKALILTFSEIDKQKYLEAKNKYLLEVIKPIEEARVKNYTKDHLNTIRKMHELEIEILKAKLDVIKSKMEGLK